MPTPAEQDHHLAPPAHLAGAPLPFSVELAAEAGEDSLYREIADRRAQLENADILRRARAL